MGLRCSSCGHDNDPTRVYCHNCGVRLERGGQAAPPPTGFTHPTDVMKMKKPRQPLGWGKYFGGLVRLVITTGFLTAVVLALLPPRDVPPPVAADPDLADRLSTLIATSAAANGTRAFGVPAPDVNTWLVTKVVFQEPDNLIKLKPERIYAVPGNGDVRVGVQAALPIGLSLYFEGLYAPVPESGGYGLEARRFSIGRLPLPSVAGTLVQRQFDSLRDSMSVVLGQLSRATHIGVTPETVTLRWSGASR